MKRYCQVVILLRISVVNALIVYKVAAKKNVNIRQFRELLATKLLGSEDTTKSCSQRGQHNVAVRKSVSAVSVIHARKLCYSNKRRH